MIKNSIEYLNFFRKKEIIICNIYYEREIKYIYNQYNIYNIFIIKNNKKKL